MAPISVGIELEFHLAYLRPNMKRPVGETRTLIFPDPDLEDLTLGPINNSSFVVNTIRIRDHLAILLHNSGFPVDLDAPEARNMNYWQVSDDFTLKEPEPEDGDPNYFNQYGYVGVELKSPALEFNEKNIAEVKKVCNLLNETYVVSCNWSTGFHVHIGHFNISDPFPFGFLKRFVAFMYTFDPQISSLHSMDRLTGEWSHKMRDAASLVATFRQAYGYRALPADLIPRFLAAKDKDTLITMASEAISKMNAINFDGVRKAEEMGDAENGEGNTIEFRQHAGTVDGQEVCMWVRTLAGMIKFIEEVSPQSFAELIITLMKAETWEKEFDGGDGEKEAELGLIPADGPFTIIDLLNHIGLTEEAAFYSGKWIVHRSDTLFRPEAQHQSRRWKFLTEHDSDDEEYQNGMRLTEIWERFRAYNSMRDQNRNIGWSWVRDASYWPERY